MEAAESVCSSAHTIVCPPLFAIFLLQFLFAIFDCNFCLQFLIAYNFCLQFLIAILFAIFDCNFCLQFLVCNFCFAIFVCNFCFASFVCNFHFNFVFLANSLLICNVLAIDFTKSVFMLVQYKHLLILCLSVYLS